MTDQQLTYEAARDELVEVVRRPESGGASLAESTELWQRGVKLAEICQGFLDGAKEQVAKARPAAQ